MTDGTKTWRLTTTYTWLLIGFCIVAAWYVENTDRRAYVLRLEMEKRHAKQLTATQLQTKAAAEETLLSFLCHEIRNPYCALLGYVEFIHTAGRTRAAGGGGASEFERGACANETTKLKLKLCGTRSDVP
jgi:hypothetical protein